MKFRKLACTVLAGAAILGLAACGNSGGSKDAGSSSSEKQKSLGGHSQSSHKKKLVTVLELMKNQSSKLLKKQIQM